MKIRSGRRLNKGEDGGEADDRRRAGQVAGSSLTLTMRRNRASSIGAKIHVARRYGP